MPGRVILTLHWYSLISSQKGRDPFFARSTDPLKNSNQEKIFLTKIENNQRTQTESHILYKMGLIIILKYCPILQLNLLESVIRTIIDLNNHI